MLYKHFKLEVGLLHKLFFFNFLLFWAPFIKFQKICILLFNHISMDTNKFWNGYFYWNPEYWNYLYPPPFPPPILRGHNSWSVHFDARFLGSSPVLPFQKTKWIKFYILMVKGGPSTMFNLRKIHLK